jgi:mono/diheme cytochrome c family protein
MVAPASPFPTRHRRGLALAVVVGAVAVLVFLLGAVVILSWQNGPLPSGPALPPYVDGQPEASLRQNVHRPQVVAQGHDLFVEHCTLCHGIHGEGAIGPNLRDDYWIGGNDMHSIVTRIADGLPRTGMIGWRSVLNQAQLEALAAYITSLAGSEDGTGKAPEGTRQPITWR